MVDRCTSLWGSLLCLSDEEISSSTVLTGQDTSFTGPVKETLPESFVSISKRHMDSSITFQDSFCLISPRMISVT